jgi:acyl carrier protein
MSDMSASSATPFELELAGLFVSALNLDVKPADIDPTGPIYGDGLGLDSIDILEVALVVSKKYGITLRADDQDNKKIFASLRELATHIQGLRSAAA